MNSANPAVSRYSRAPSTFFLCSAVPLDLVPSPRERGTSLRLGSSNGRVLWVLVPSHSQKTGLAVATSQQCSQIPREGSFLIFPSTPGVTAVLVCSLRTEILLYLEKVLWRGPSSLGRRAFNRSFLARLSASFSLLMSVSSSIGALRTV